MNEPRIFLSLATLSAALALVLCGGLEGCGGSTGGGGGGGKGGAGATAGASGHGGGGAGRGGGDAGSGGTGGGDAGSGGIGGLGGSGGGGSGGGGSGGGGSGGGGSGGGGSGGGGSGGGGSGGGPTLPAPGCLQDLFAACPIAGECHPRAADGGGAGYCFASGVGAEQLQVHGCGAGIDGGVSSDKVRVYKPDGSLCFTFEAVWHYSCEFAGWTWTNAAGETVATGSGSWGQGTYAGVQCAGGGAAVTCAGGCPSVADLGGPFGPFGPRSCSPGACP